MIKAHVVDAEVLGARTPTEIATYLLGTGWTVASRSELVTVWVRGTARGEAEIIQPRDRRLRDYALRVADALAMLAAVEDRSELGILRDISASTWDVHAVRLFPDATPPGLIRVDDGVAAYQSLRDLVSAAAYPIFAGDELALQPAEKPPGLVDFMRGVCFGPASEGSFVLTVVMPLPPHRVAQDGPGRDVAQPEATDTEPIERRVSLRLHSALLAARTTAESALALGGNRDRLADAVERGVSANLCEALAGLGGGNGIPFEFTVALAPALGLPVRPEPVRFDPHHLPILSEVATYLRADQQTDRDVVPAFSELKRITAGFALPDEEVEVVGEVVRLSRRGAGGGEIAIRTRLDDSDNVWTVWIVLAADEYATAMTAHRDVREIAMRGHPVRSGRRIVLRDPSGLHVLSGPGSDDRTR